MSEPAGKPGLWRVFKSVAASMFGVQSDKNRQHDFSQQSFLPFMLVGIVFVVVMVIALVILVNLITPARA